MGKWKAIGRWLSRSSAHSTYTYIFELPRHSLILNCVYNTILVSVRVHIQFTTKPKYIYEYLVHFPTSLYPPSCLTKVNAQKNCTLRNGFASLRKMCYHILLICCPTRFSCRKFDIHLGKHIYVYTHIVRPQSTHCPY